MKSRHVALSLLSFLSSNFPLLLKTNKQTNNFYLYQRHKCMKLQEAYNHGKNQFFVISAHLLFPKETTFTNYIAAEFCLPLQL